jgi:hypothetical protein
VFLSAERTAHANRTILSTFEQTSVAWQTIPHWDTGDPGQFRVRRDRLAPTTTASAHTTGDDPPPHPPLGGDSLPLDGRHRRFLVTLAQATAPTPDALLASVIGQTVELAKDFDTTVLQKLGEGPTEPVKLGAGPSVDPEAVLAALLACRRRVEEAGYRADSCLVAGDGHYQAINQCRNGLFVARDLLCAAAVNGLYRVAQLNSDYDPAPPGAADLSLFLARRTEIAHRCAAEASPGEEPVDLAVSLPPSLEVVGDNGNGQIELAIRVRFALRVKDERGLVVLTTSGA